jgi:hypothetical protein
MPIEPYDRLQQIPRGYGYLSGSASIKFTATGVLTAIEPLKVEVSIVQPTIEIRKPAAKLWAFPRFWDVLIYALPMEARQGYWADYHQALSKTYAQALQENLDRPLFRLYLNSCFVLHTVVGLIGTYGVAIRSAIICMVLPKGAREMIRAIWEHFFPPQL